MNQGKYVFAQLTEFLPRRVFDRIADKYSGNKHVRTFTCWNQMLCMVFGQLTSRDSMRDLKPISPSFIIWDLDRQFPAETLAKQMRTAVIRSSKSSLIF